MAQQVRKRRPYAARVPIETRRAQLLDAALLVIDREGFDKVSIDAIAREAGVTRPVVYGAFDDLRTLLGALLDRQQQRAVEQLYDALPLDALAAGPHELVRRAVPALHAMVRSDPVNWRMVLTSGTAAPAVMQERIASDRARVLATISTLLADRVGPKVDVELMAQAIVAMLEHFGRLMLAEPDAWPPERLARAALGVLPR